MQQNITPLPWRVNGPYIEVDNETLGQCFHMLGHAREGSVANAAFIVKACNAHDALVAALTDAREQVRLMANNIGCPPHAAGASRTLSKIDAALAAAGE